MTEPIYRICLMCNLVDVGSVRVSEKMYLEAGGNPKELSHGICESNDCRNAYVMLASGGDETLAEIVKKELKKP